MLGAEQNPNCSDNPNFNFNFWHFDNIPFHTNISISGDHPCHYQGGDPQTGGEGWQQCRDHLHRQWGPHTHCDMVMGNILSALRVAFKPERVLPRKPWITEVSWNLTRARSALQVAAGRFDSGLAKALKTINSTTVDFFDGSWIGGGMREGTKIPEKEWRADLHGRV